MDKKLVLVRGAGDLATGVLCTLHTFGYTVVAAETEKPSSIRRTVSLSEAVYEGSYTVENSTAEYCANKNDISRILSAGKIPLLADPACTVIKSLHPDIVVDAIMAKKIPEPPKIWPKWSSASARGSPPAGMFTR